MAEENEKAQKAEGVEGKPSGEGKETRKKADKKKEGAQAKADSREGKEPGQKGEKKGDKKDKKGEKKGEAAKPEEKLPPRFLLRYRSEVIPKLTEKFGYKNPMAVPRLLRIVLNSGVRQGDDREKRLTAVVKDLGTIAGQRPAIVKAKRSVSGFRLREGDRIAAKVTLRGARMYEFMDRLVSLALPRVRDFRGLNPKSFDGYGNYSFGITEHIVFPEVDLDSTEHFFGMDVTFVTTAGNDDEGRELLRAFGVPFREN